MRNLNKIIVENHIPFIKGVLEPVAQVQYLSPEEITPDTMLSADALITRTRTRCDSALLSGSKCRFIATATIGTDHIDLPWCESHGITVANAPGCNAPAVAQYVMRAVIEAFPDGVAGLTIGVVGVGNVGRIVARWAESLGMTVLLCDPPRARRETDGDFVTLDEIARRSDVITFHTPLTASGPDATYHLAGKEFFSRLRRRPLIINAARGGVVDEQYLIKALDVGTVRAAAIDCWECEPEISPELLSKALIATPHIAGYSRQGKIRATAMAVDAFCRHFGVKAAPLPVEIPADAPAEVTAGQITDSYDVMADTRLLKASAGSRFESLRNGYTLREEP